MRLIDTVELVFLKGNSVVKHCFFGPSLLSQGSSLPAGQLDDACRAWGSKFMSRALDACNEGDIDLFLLKNEVRWGKLCVFVRDGAATCDVATSNDSSGVIVFVEFA